MKKNLKIAKEKIAKPGSKGITLIALVVTIVVLLILAGITINAVLSEGGIFNTAKNAENVQQHTSVKEKVQVMLADAQLEKLVNNKTLKAYLEEQGHRVAENTSEGTVQIIVEGYGVTINKETLEISKIEENAQLPEPEDSWDGTENTSWYNNTDTEFTLSTSEQLAGLATLVDEGNTFEGKTIKLDSNLDLRCEKLATSTGDYRSFNPIGGDGYIFKGTFDGQGHTIKNIYQSGWDFEYQWGQYGSIGLFGEVDGAIVKNLTISGFEGQIEGGDIAVVAGTATGECIFENITIKDCKIGTYNNGCGSIIGWSGDGIYTFKNINIGEDVVIAGMWGSYDSSLGGVVGQAESGATYNFENVNIACKIDAYNDVMSSYQWFCYRTSGMIIGMIAAHTINNVNAYPDMTSCNITCTNVKVIYNDWINYHYCQGVGTMGSKYARVENGYTYDGLDLNDSSHNELCTHHLVCLPFNQLFGCDSRKNGSGSTGCYAAHGIEEYEGVTVVYNCEIEEEE